MRQKERRIVNAAIEFLKARKETVLNNINSHTNEIRRLEADLVAQREYVEAGKVAILELEAAIRQLESWLPKPKIRASALR